jgi:hypothetical protein
MLKKGDAVRWKTAARGHRRVKEGEVFAVVPPGTSPAEAVELAGQNPIDVQSRFDLMFSYFAFWTRRDISYLILVDNREANAMPRLYWPRASSVKKLS